MKTNAGLVLGSAIGLLAAAATPAAEVSGYIAATSDYVRRGISQSDGDPTLQLGVDLNFDSGLFLGAWGSGIDIASGPSRQRDIETNYYVGYFFEAGKRWTLSANAVGYVFPGAKGGTDYDYIEYAVTAGYDDKLWLEYATTNDLYGMGIDIDNYEAYLELPLASTWLMGGGVGYAETSQLSGTGYGYWQLGLTHLIGAFQLDLRYHDTNRPLSVLRSSDLADARVVVSLSYSF